MYNCSVGSTIYCSKKEGNSLEGYVWSTRFISPCLEVLQYYVILVLFYSDHLVYFPSPFSPDDATENAIFHSEAPVRAVHLRHSVPHVDQLDQSAPSWYTASGYQGHFHPSEVRIEGVNSSDRTFDIHVNGLSSCRFCRNQIGCLLCKHRHSTAI